MKETVKWIVSTVITLVLIAVAAMTCPSESAHKRRVTDTIKKEIKREYSSYKEDGNFFLNILLSGVSSVERLTVSSYINNNLIVDDFWLFSIGSIPDSEGSHLTSLGVFDHVFVSPLYVETLVNSLEKK